MLSARQTAGDTTVVSYGAFGVAEKWPIREDRGGTRGLLDVIPEKFVTVLLSVLIVVLVAVVQNRSRHLAAIIATMPLTAPLAMWIVFSASRGDQRQTAEFVGSIWLLIVLAPRWVSSAS
jgi:hypothetical protein